MNPYIIAARKAIESQYDAKCDVVEKRPKEVNNITKNIEEKVLIDKDCRVSFEDIYANTETDTEEFWASVGIMGGPLPTDILLMWYIVGFFFVCETTLILWNVSLAHCL